MPAAAFKTALGNTFNNVSGTTLVLTTTAAIAVGDLVVVRWASDNLSATTPTATCADSGGNTYTVQRQAAGNATAAAGIAGGILTSLATAVVNSGQTITLTFSGAIVGKAMYAESFTGALNTTRMAVVGSAGTTGTAATSGASAAGTVAGDLALGFSAVQTRTAATGDADTTFGTWSTKVGVNGGATSGQDAGSVQINGQYKLVTGAGALSYDNTVTSTYWVTGLVVLQQAPNPAISQAAYQFFDDAGTESGAASLAALNTSVVGNLVNGDGFGVLRTRLQLTTAVAVLPTDDWQLQWTKGGDEYGFSNYSGNGYGLRDIQTQVAQAFTGTAGPLTRATFWLSAASGAASGTVQAVLLAHSGTFGSGTPTGSPLATSTTTLTASTVPLSPTSYSFDFGGTFTLVAGTPYFIGLVATGASSTALTVASDNTSPTHPGNAVYWQSSWNSTTNDLCFEVGTWTNITTGGTTVQGFNNTNLTDGAATTNRLGAGTGTFVAGKISETGDVPNLGWSASNYTELVYSLKLLAANLADGDILRFRVVYNGASTYMTYTQTPTITIKGPVAVAGTSGGSSTTTADLTVTSPAITQAAYRWYDEGTETGAPALAAQNTAATGDVTTADGIGQLRVLLQSTNAANMLSTDDFQLQWEKNTSGTWINTGQGLVILDSSSVTTGDINPISAGDASNSIGQTFISTGGNLTSVEFFMSRTATAPPGTVTAKLYAHSGTFGLATGIPTGAALASSTPRNASVFQTTEQWEAFTFDGTYSLVSGTPYAVAVEYTVGGGTTFMWVGRTSAGAHPGRRVLRNTGTGVWTADATASNDASHRVYTISASTVLPYNSPNLTDGAATTSRLTGGSGTFTAGKISETGLVSDVGWLGNNYTELLYSLDIVNTDVINGDTLRFRVLRNGATTGMTYTQVPTLNVVAAAGAAVALAGSSAGSSTTTAALARAVPLDASGGGIVYADDFNRANGAPGSNWNVYTGSPVISSNKLVPSSLANGLNYVTAMPSLDHWIEADVTIVSVNDYFVIHARSPVVNNQDNCVMGFVNPSTGGYIIGENVGNLYYDILTATGPGLGGPYKLRLEVEGNTYRLYHDGVLKITTSNTSHATGNYVGFNINQDSGTATIDNFRAGPLPYGVGGGGSVGVSTITGDLTVTAGGGAAVALAASSAGVATTTAAVAVAVALAGSTAGVATTTAATAVARPLAGSSVGVSSDTATLVATVALAGSTAGVSTTTAAIARGVPLAASVAGVSTVTATTLVAALPLAASVTGSSTVTGTLIATESLAGLAGGVATATATLTVTAPGGGPVALAGSSAGTSTITAAMGQAWGVAATSGGSSTASASLLITRGLAANAAGAATASAALGVTWAVTATSAGTSTVSASLARAVPVTGTTVAGVSTTTASLVVTHTLVSGADGVSTTTANLTVTHTLVVSTAGSSTASGSLTVTSPSGLAATVGGSSMASGLLVVVHQLVGSAAGSSTTSGDLGKGVPLAATVNGLSTTTGSLARSVPLAASAAGSSTGTATTVRLAIGLAGLVNGLSTVVAGLALARALVALSNGASTTAGDLFVGRGQFLSGSSAGRATAVGTLQAIFIVPTYGQWNDEVFEAMQYGDKAVVGYLMVPS